MNKETKWYEKEICSRCGHKIGNHVFCRYCVECGKASELDDAMQYSPCVVVHMNGCDLCD